MNKYYILFVLSLAILSCKPRSESENKRHSLYSIRTEDLSKLNDTDRANLPTLKENDNPVVIKYYFN